MAADLFHASQFASGAIAKSSLIAPCALRGSQTAHDNRLMQELELKVALGRALKGIREARKLRQAEVADPAHYDAGNLSRVERGKQNIAPEVLEQVARQLDVPVSLIYLLAEALVRGEHVDFERELSVHRSSFKTGRPSGGGEAPRVDAHGYEYDPSAYVFIPLLEPDVVELSAGHGQPVTHEVIDQELAFLASWLRKKQINPETSRVVTVRGDSMAPYLMDNDVVLIDTSDTAISNYKVYALEMSGELRIKRLYRRPDGTIIMHSDNPSWTPREEPITKAELENGLVRIIGRMRWRGGAGDD